MAEIERIEVTYNGGQRYPPIGARESAQGRPTMREQQPRLGTLNRGSRQSVHRQTRPSLNEGVP